MVPSYTEAETYHFPLQGSCGFAFRDNQLGGYAGCSLGTLTLHKSMLPNPSVCGGLQNPPDNTGYCQTLSLKIPCDLTIGHSMIIGHRLLKLLGAFFLSASLHSSRRCYIDCWGWRSHRHSYSAVGPTYHTANQHCRESIEEEAQTK